MTADSTDTSPRLTAPVGDLPYDSLRTLPPPRTSAPTRRRAPRVIPACGPLLADGLAAAAATALVTEGAIGPAPVLGAGLTAVLLLNRRAGLYRTRPAESALDQLPALLGCTALAWAITAALVAAAEPGAALALPTLLWLVTLHTASAAAGRALVYLARRARAERRPRSALVVGLGPACRVLAAALLARPEYGMRPVGQVACGRGDQPADGAPRLPVLTTFEDVTRAVVQNSVRDAVLTRSPAGDRDAAALAEHLAGLGCTVWWIGGGNESAAPGSPAGHLWGFACRRLAPPPRRRLAYLGKRSFDVAVALTALLALSPVLAACALAVRLADGPGVLFRQERVGQRGRPITVLKFRTLRPADDYESATRWSVAHDSRMSAVGRWLRRSSLDELPQLWNVLRGDMSLVGPRPERPFFVARFSERYPHYAARHRMPVGITGLAQVNGLRGDTSIEDRARFDNLYIDTWSPWLDLCILLRTAASLLRRGGS